MPDHVGFSMLFIPDGLALNISHPAEFAATRRNPAWGKTFLDGTNPPVVVVPPRTTTYGMDCVPQLGNRFWKEHVSIRWNPMESSPGLRKSPDIDTRQKRAKSLNLEPVEA
jgi:hypothetical protein